MLGGLDFAVKHLAVWCWQPLEMTRVGRRDCEDSAPLVSAVTRATDRLKAFHQQQRHLVPGPVAIRRRGRVEARGVAPDNNRFRVTDIIRLPAGHSNAEGPKRFG